MKGNKMYCQSFQKAVRRRETGRKTKLICIFCAPNHVLLVIMS